MQSVAETSIFSRRADALLSRDERAELIALLATTPKAGDVIPGTGGIRKLCCSLLLAKASVARSG